jgi:adenylosuccinate synthase
VEADAAADRVSALSQVSGVLGSQWGDEGKGKLVDVLAPRFDIVARCQVRRHGPVLVVSRFCLLC